MGVYVPYAVVADHQPSTRNAGEYLVHAAWISLKAQFHTQGIRDGPLYRGCTKLKSLIKAVRQILARGGILVTVLSGYYITDRDYGIQA